MELCIMGDVHKFISWRPLIVSGIDPSCRASHASMRLGRYRIMGTPFNFTVCVFVLLDGALDGRQ
jgi:hypothetical protein